MESLERRGLAAGLTLRHHRSLTGTPSAQLFTGYAPTGETPTEVADQSGNRYRLMPIP